MDILPFTVYLESEPDFDACDHERALSAHLQQQQLIGHFLHGTEHADAVLDCLAEGGFEPSAYVRQVGLNLGMLNDSGLWLIGSE